MGTGEVLVDIQPEELKFTFELKKQSSCSIQLVNKSTDYVAFKVKTTSPKRYCVRPNTGIILPRSTCNFTVTMQAPKETPPDMQLKDKFLVQTTIVPYGTTDEDITPSFFSKETGRYIQENKLRVVLLSPPHSPVKPINGALMEESANKKSDSSEISNSNNCALKHEPADQVPLLGQVSISSEGTVNEEPIHENLVLKETCVSNDQKPSGIADATSVRDLDILFLVAKEIDGLKLKLNNLELKLDEAEKTITSLRTENSAAIQLRDNYEQEIALLRRKSVARVQRGFPLLFVLFVMLVSMTLGYLFHSRVQS
ncbi:vesicle-associated protein 1-3 [Canna indica]|uniref:Vesicle-associated protein 1-3 n=1 Tax=Canna indica TaxID=4628 RepID=A0AAQ3JQZ6_9LILI|nr:vesicle-associated protein 1-3 [Canna indica]